MFTALLYAIICKKTRTSITSSRIIYFCSDREQKNIGLTHCMGQTLRQLKCFFELHVSYVYTRHTTYLELRYH